MTIQSIASCSWPNVAAGRAPRIAMLGTVVAILGFAGAEWLVLIHKALVAGSTLGVDFHLYLGYTHQWLAGDGFYGARQIDGAYILGLHDSLYPPTSIWLFLPFVLLPAALGWLWWCIPLGIIAAVIVRLRPAPWTWLVMAAILAWPRTPELIIYGNPTMWVGAAVAAGLIWSWPGVFVLLKPSLGPFALIGIKRRSWWLGLGVLVVASLPLLGLWGDYRHVVTDVQDSGGLAYSLRDAPFVALPIVAWLGRRRGASVPSLGG